MTLDLGEFVENLEDRFGAVLALRIVEALQSNTSALA
jgi:dTDP-4-amino-4,6-dideoxygalactose transaminase